MVIRVDDLLCICSVAAFMTVMAVLITGISDVPEWVVFIIGVVGGWSGYSLWSRRYGSPEDQSFRVHLPCPRRS